MYNTSDNIQGFQSIRGLSTDTKPTDKMPNGVTNIENGAEFYCMDTQEVYLFDAQNKVWIKQG